VGRAAVAAGHRLGIFLGGIGGGIRYGKAEPAVETTQYDGHRGLLDGAAPGLHGLGQPAVLCATCRTTLASRSNSPGFCEIS
jgi:hypothetical protein